MADNIQAVVTGGSRGIGAAIAEKLVLDGMDVIVTGVKKDGAGPKGTEYYPVDFCDRTAIKDFCYLLSKKKVGVLVNNAGINRISGFNDILLSDFDDIIDVNLRAPFMLCQAVLPEMLNSKWGRIVNITSIFGDVSKAHRALYSASKFGLTGLTKALAAEVAEYGVLVNAVGPGVIDTALTRSVLGEEGIKTMKQAIPAGRMGEPVEIASFVSWLASEKNTYIAGQHLLIDGGYTVV